MMNYYHWDYYFKIPSQGNVLPLDILEVVKACNVFYSQALYT